MKRTTLSERSLILAPRGRDASIAAALLREAGLEAHACASLPALIEELDQGAGFVVLTAEALSHADTAPLVAWLADQESWSDLPFVLLTVGGGGLERNAEAQRLSRLLGNVTFLERPFHPTTLVSLAQSALRARMRQYEARARLAELRDSEERYRTLFENIDQGFCVIEFVDGPSGPLSDFVHVDANPAYVTHAGFVDVVGRRVRELVPEEADKWVALYRDVLESGEPIRTERELLSNQRHLELSAFRVDPPNRRQVAVLFQDITARKHAEQALRVLNETLEQRVTEALAERGLFASIVEGTDAMVQVADTEFRWLAVNKSAAAEFTRVFGTPPRVGTSMLEVLNHRPAQRREVEELWGRALAGEEFTEVRGFAGPDARIRHYEIKFNVLRDADGKRIGAYQFVYDVSDRIESHQRLATAEEALRQSQKMEALGQLTGGVAHDFNNLLTVIKSSAVLLKRGTADEQRRRHHIDAISETVDRAAKLTAQLLSFARRQALNPEVFDVAEQVRGLIDMLHTMLGSRIVIDVDLPSWPCLVKADVNQFETAIVNVAVNARDAMNGEGRLSINAAVAERRDPGTGELRESVEVSIGDSGSGIDPDKLQAIFEPFFTTKAVGKGTGLGLSQVYGFARQSGGDVLVSSTLGVGTTFTLVLPTVEKNSDAESTAKRQMPPSNVPSPGRRSGKLLIVEDNEIVGAASSQLLQELGYETTWANSATEALARLAAEPDFIGVFTDVVMPGMSGIELGREVRRLYPGLPVILTTGYSDVLSQEGRHGFELLQKPYDTEALAQILERTAKP